MTGSPSPSHRFLLPGVLLVLLAAYLLAWNAYYVGYFNDDASYILLAKGLLTHQRYVADGDPFLEPHRVYLPGYPIFLTPFVAMVKVHYEWLKGVSVLVTLGAAALFWKLLDGALPPMAKGLLVLLAFLNPFVILLSGTVMSDPLYMLLSFLFFFLLSQQGKGWAHWKWGMLLGCGVAAAASTRVVGFLLLLPVWFIAWRGRRGDLFLLGTIPSLLLYWVGFLFGWVKTYVRLPSAPFHFGANGYGEHLLQYLHWSCLSVTGRYVPGTPITTSEIPWLLGFTGLLVMGILKSRGFRVWGAIWVYFAGFLIVLAHFQFADIRLLFPVVPLMIAALVFGVLPRCPGGKFPAWGYWVLVGALAVNLAGVLRVHSLYISGPPLANKPPSGALDWVRNHVKPDAIIMGESWPVLYLLTARPAVGILEDPLNLLRVIYARKVCYIVLYFKPLHTAKRVADVPREVQWYVSRDTRRFQLVYQNLHEESQVYKVLDRRNEFLTLYKLFQEGVGLFGKGDLQAGIKRFQDILEIDPDFFAAQHLLGISLAEAGHVRESETLFQKSIAKWPHMERGYMGLAHTYWKQGNHRRALRLLEYAMMLAEEQHHLLEKQEIVRQKALINNGTNVRE